MAAPCSIGPSFAKVRSPLGSAATSKLSSAPIGDLSKIRDPKTGEGGSSPEEEACRLLRWPLFGVAECSRPKRNYWYFTLGRVTMILRLLLLYRLWVRKRSQGHTCGLFFVRQTALRL